MHLTSFNSLFSFFLASVVYRRNAFRSFLRIMRPTQWTIVQFYFMPKGLELKSENKIRDEITIFDSLYICNTSFTLIFFKLLMVLIWGI